MRYCKIMNANGLNRYIFWYLYRYKIVPDNDFALMSAWTRKMRGIRKKRRRKSYVVNWGNALCNGQHVCFPSLSPVLECGFESRLGLEFLDFSMWHFMKLVIRGFLRVLRFPPPPPPPSPANGFTNKIKVK